MKEPYGEGLAPHTDPESCVDGRKVGGEALTGARTGQPLSCEIKWSGTPTLLRQAEGNTKDGDMREPSEGPAQSKTLCTCGNSLRGNREVPGTPSPDGGDGRSGKAGGQKPDKHVSGKSDGCIVPGKPLNKGMGSLSAEAVEGRRPTKGNARQAVAVRTQSRTAASIGLQRVRDMARKDKDARFTALLHHVSIDMLGQSFRELKREATPGVDGLTCAEYEDGLRERLKELHARVHRGSYRAQPSKRIHIPKPDGHKRPIGIAALEDKIVQHAVGKVLSAIYEEDFLGFSYGFRPRRGAHDALDALNVGLTHRKVSWVLDADIQGFFDTISHEWMIRFLEHRIADPRILRLVRKWLRVGVSEDGVWSQTSMGTPQGAVISPILGNIYLHYVLDQWVHHRRRHARGDIIIVRYADDYVLGFQYRHEAERFLTDLKARLDRFGLSLHPEKTRLIEFGRFATESRRKRGQGKPETFDFLGFTHMCGITRIRKRFLVRRKTVKKRLRAALKRVKTILRSRMHDPINDVGEWLQRVLLGYYRYHAVPGNLDAMRAFRDDLVRYWYKVLRRRGQKRRINWRGYGPIVKRWISRPRVMHPYPNERFYAKYPR
ncbi:RNA-directed DNA polymerase (Reverse transcriptase) [Desulfohalobium retbaense DSM 5692]|uniref:RNA-directed DNA polymerase (Reverse transcriptase) n=2 Tax=Desulfohalobium TaxID=45662 RepID=C8X235_DESRD|nr:RNA-directed DNA polymerase (Reverse transcriptase) [Desulfohalobium retbaense DSM 5692]